MNPLRILGRFPRPVRLLLLGTLVNKLGTFILPYLTLVLLRDFRLRESQAATLIFAYGIGTIVALLAGGALCDKLGRRRTLLVSLLGSGVLAVAMGLAGTVRAFVPLLMAFAFVGELYRPAAAAVISDLLPSAQRASGFAGLRMAVNVGWASGTALGGLLADWDWRLLFLGDGLTTLAYGVIVYVSIPETRPHSRRATLEANSPAPPSPPVVPPGQRPANVAPSPLRDVVFAQITATSFLLSLVFCSHLTVFPLTVTRSAGYPAVAYGLFAAVNGLLVALLELSIVARLTRYRRLRVAALGYMLCATGFGMLGLLMHWAWFLLAVVVFTAGEILALPQAMSFVADWAPAAARGRYLSVYQANWSIAFAVNPAVTLPLHAALGEAAFWSLAPAVSIPAVLVLLRLDRVADRPERLRGLAAGR